MTAGKLPKKYHIGMRNIKTAICAALCALLYLPFGRSPAFACIGAIFGLGSDMDDSITQGGNRLFGTLFGGVIGVVLFWVYLHFVPDGAHTPLLAALVFIGTVLLIEVCHIFWVGGVQPGSVVLCILLFNTPPETYVAYMLARTFDTAVGVLIAWVFSWVFPRGWRGLWPQRIAAWKARRGGSSS